MMDVMIIYMDQRALMLRARLTPAQLTELDKKICDVAADHPTPACEPESEDALRIDLTLRPTMTIGGFCFALIYDHGSKYWILTSDEPPPRGGRERKRPAAERQGATGKRLTLKRRRLGRPSSARATMVWDGDWLTDLTAAFGCSPIRRRLEAAAMAAKEAAGRVIHSVAETTGKFVHSVREMYNNGHIDDYYLKLDKTLEILREEWTGAFSGSGSRPGLWDLDGTDVMRGCMPIRQSVAAVGAMVDDLNVLIAGAAPSFVITEPYVESLRKNGFSWLAFESPRHSRLKHLENAAAPDPFLHCPTMRAGARVYSRGSGKLRRNRWTDAPWAEHIGR